MRAIQRPILLLAAGLLASTVAVGMGQSATAAPTGPGSQSAVGGVGVAAPRTVDVSKLPATDTPLSAPLAVPPTRANRLGTKALPSRPGGIRPGVPAAPGHSNGPNVTGSTAARPLVAPGVVANFDGVVPPAGCIYKADPDGNDWELWSAGYRNAFDAAFNRHGELFTYDSDMEWDMNTPWYRPTRVCLATSGSEFGFRDGSDNSPPRYVDTLPAIHDSPPTRRLSGSLPHVSPPGCPLRAIVLNFQSCLPVAAS